MASEEVDVYDYWGRGSGLANWLMDKMDPSWYSEDFFEEMSKNGISKFTDFRHFDSSSFNSTLNEMDWNSNQKKEFYQKFEHDFGIRFPNLFGNNNKNDNGEERKKSKSSKRRSKRGNGNNKTSEASKNEDITMGNTENVKSDNGSRRRTRRGGAANAGTGTGTGVASGGGVGSEAANSSSKAKSSKKSKSSKKVKSVKEDQDSEMKTKSNKKNKKKSKKSSKSNKMDDEKASTKKKKSSNGSKNKNKNDNNNNNNINDNIDNNGNEIFEFMDGIDVLCLHNDGKVYEARVLARKKAAMDGRIIEEYLLHFRNWNSRYDAWVSGDNIFDKTPDNLKAMHECNARMTK